MTNLEWIKAGNTGCTFATLFSKNPEMVGWKSYYYTDFAVIQTLNEVDSLIVSIIFPETWTLEIVRAWALAMNFYEEETSDTTSGLRIDCPEGKSWVQYFGPDSHVITRRAPQPMLMYTNKLGKSHYVKVGYKGILHLAHAWYSGISERVYDLLWERSYKQTEKKLKQRPDITQAAKTTWLKQ